MKLYISISLTLTLLATLTGCNSVTKSPSLSYATQAEEHFEAGEYQRAKEAYLLHINERLKSDISLQEENPYFYFLKIADIFVLEGDLENAERAYSVVLKQNIDPNLLVTRVRNLAKAHFDAGNSKTAMKILRAYRSLDELLFDSDLDEIQKELISRENGLAY